MLSSKTFVLVDRPFWRDTDPETGQPVMSMTLTDRLPAPPTSWTRAETRAPHRSCSPTRGTTTR
ncbi:hypothetical protein [Nesterenkonia pannonica]|uniref:hypothetical protein n=1 Tax=Nesterenkonia pannonica TaxID=1548602 RepID=UPI002164A228|nr:hypothetical protein [Nesterenkonia pannonica]